MSDRHARVAVAAAVYLQAAKGFAACAVMLFVILLQVNLMTKKQDEGNVKSPGQLMVEMTWPDGIDVDVDLWTQAPNDVPVGFSNLNGHIMNLLRDDLGNKGDFMSMNYENAYSRGLPPGEYVVNVYLYGNRTMGARAVRDVPVRVAVTLRTPNTAEMSTHGTRVVEKTVTLHYVGQEITVIRFTLNDKGQVVAGSESELYKPLMAVKGQQ